MKRADKCINMVYTYYMEDENMETIVKKWGNSLGIRASAEQRSTVS
jgi:hypothetical protein